MHPRKEELSHKNLPKTGVTFNVVQILNCGQFLGAHNTDNINFRF